MTRWLQYGIPIDASDWSWQRFDSRVVLRPTAETWMRYLIIVVTMLGVSLPIGFGAFGLPWNPRERLEPKHSPRPKNEDHAKLNDAMLRLRESFREYLGEERFAEIERKAAEDVRQRELQNQISANRLYWVGVAISLAGWVLFSPLIVFGLVYLGKLLRLPLARVTIERFPDGRIIVIAPTLFGSYSMHVEGARLIEVNSWVRRNRKYGARYKLWQVHFACSAINSDRYPILKIDEIRNYSDERVPERVSEFVRELCQAMNLPSALSS